MPSQTIVIADDEPHLTSIVAFNLKKAGFVVHVATNGELCCKISAEVLPDLIVSDYQMPVLDGLGACIKLRDNPATADIPIIMLTARGHRLTPDEIARTNIKALMAKPFSARDLLAKVQDILNGSAATKVAA